MKLINLKWLCLSFIACLTMMGIVQVYLYKNTLSDLHLINDAFIAGQISFCLGGTIFIIQGGSLKLSVKSIRNFLQSLTRYGRWIRANTFEEEKSIYIRKKRHPMALCSALVGPLFCIISLLLSHFI